jgi:hypothetical protein
MSNKQAQKHPGQPKKDGIKPLRIDFPSPDCKKHKKSCELPLTSFGLV